MDERITATEESVASLREYLISEQQELDSGDQLIRQYPPNAHYLYESSTVIFLASGCTKYLCWPKYSSAAGSTCSG